MAIVKDTLYEIEYDGRHFEFQTYAYAHNGQRADTNYMGAGIPGNRVQAQVVSETITAEGNPTGQGYEKTVVLLVHLPDVDKYTTIEYSYFDYSEMYGEGNIGWGFNKVTPVLDMFAEGV